MHRTEPSVSNSPSIGVQAAGKHGGDLYRRWICRQNIMQEARTVSDISSELLARYRSGQRRFAGEDLSELYLPGETLKDADFSDCMFHNCRIATTIFDGSNFTGAEFE